jgi:hypothetical protein
VTRSSQGVPLPALGRFSHEAVTFDEGRQQLYLTEDRPDGRLYRFTPARYPDLSEGALEVLAADDTTGAVTWLPVLSQTEPQELAGRPEGSRAFDGGEGIWFDSDHVYFTTKGENRVYDLDVAAQRLTVLYDAESIGEDAPLTGVDNLVVSQSADIFVAEDGGNLESRDHHARRAVAPVLRLVGHDNSEICGPAFSPGRLAHVLLLPARHRRARGHLRGGGAVPHPAHRAAGPRHRRAAARRHGHRRRRRGDRRRRAGACARRADRRPPRTGRAVTGGGGHGRRQRRAGPRVARRDRRPGGAGRGGCDRDRGRGVAARGGPSYVRRGPRRARGPARLAWRGEHRGSRRGRRGLRDLLAVRDFRRLMGVRVTGAVRRRLFQAALFSAVFFNPERATSAAQAAAAFATLLLPLQRGRAVRRRVPRPVAAPAGAARGQPGAGRGDRGLRDAARGARADQPAGRRAGAGGGVGQPVRAVRGCPRRCRTWSSRARS